MSGRILITQGTRPFAQRVGKLLQVQYEVLFGAADEIPQVLLRTGNYMQFPQVNAAAFEHVMLRTCLDGGVDVLIPLGEQEIRALARTQQLFAEYGIAVWVPDAGHLDELGMMRNPGRHYPLLVLDRGTAVVGEQPPTLTHTMSGVFARLDSAHELAWCCIAD
ncbi:hypothetical protein [Parapedobacter soli]|uniref:hypothetical protein n=1 Tax=Parapedobacter soli TaxID=416955 RepID=UPI0021C8FEFF|nr:hypothetical protein [Parapedobacter soli]